METSAREYGPWREIEIDGIKALARRQKDAPSFAKWEIVEAQTKLSLMPPSWPGGLSAGTLDGAMHIVQTEVIDKQGKEKILQRIKEVVAKSSLTTKEVETSEQAKIRIKNTMQRQSSGAFFKEIPRTEGSLIPNTGHLTPEQLRNQMIEHQNEQIAARHEELRQSEVKKTWEGKHNGYVKDNTYFNLAGESIHIGDEITMSFAGGPSNMPRPWKLVKAENYFSSVDYANRVRITVEASNGKQMTLDSAHIYSPHPVQSKTIVQTGLGIKLDKTRLARHILPRTKAGLAKHKKHPNRYDIRGIDTPSVSTMRKRH